ncbi:hypothetical protein T4A_6666 [Trichinella pseudospiralis]|uniref:Uncharacterized protein n=1 Tax=Trichinella pseudospiralis TaxID=6337 RepID=A0A0V1EAE3_TRIPS|nr:hypothetical protein T4A_6666 [Trichinella pseudospiralis]
MFGNEHSAGLKSHLLPQSLLKETTDMGETEIFFSRQTSGVQHEIDDEELFEVENGDEDKQPLTIEPSFLNDHHFRRVRATVAEGERKHAVVVTAWSKKSLTVLARGQCAMLKILKVDHGLAEPQNLLMVVLKITNGLYTSLAEDKEYFCQSTQPQTWSQ